MDDSSCRFDIPGCTNSNALNYFVLAEVDDGSCIFIGCTSSVALNYNPTANVDDGSCVAIILGCMNSTAANFSPPANTDDGSCIFAGCTNSTAKNFESWAQIDDGSCIPYRVGCRNSTAANYNASAEVDGLCLFYGCTASMATNFDAGAGVDDGTCTFVSVSGTIASFGYLSGCRVFLDGFGSTYSPEGKRGREDPYDTSSAIGHYTVVYRQQGVINVQPANATGGFPCTDDISGSSLAVPLRTLMNASLVSSLTTIATALVGASLSNRTGQPTLHASPDQGQRNFSDALGNFSVAAAANMVCRNLIPPVPCADSFQPCDSATGFADACTLNGAPLSVFHFDALHEYMSSDLPEAAWSAWIVGQVNTYFTVGCATTALICASREMVGSEWTTSCAAEGAVMGNYTREALNTAIFFSLAEMIALGPANLEDQTGSGVADLISRASARLGVAPINALSLTQSCGMQNFVTYTSLTGAGSGRRALAAEAEQALSSSSTDAPSGAATEATPVAADEDVEELAGDVANRVGRVCDALQPHRSHCRQRLERVLVRLAAQEEKRRRLLEEYSSRRSTTVAVAQLAPLAVGSAPLEIGSAPLEIGSAPLEIGSAPEPTRVVLGWWYAPLLLLTALVTTILFSCSLKKGGQHAGRKLEQRDQHGARLPAGVTSAYGSLAGSPPGQSPILIPFHRARQCALYPALTRLARGE